MSGKRYKRQKIVPAAPNAQVARNELPSEIKLSASFSGPIPPPNLLAQYNEIIPNGAERILAMAERQSAHRERMESRVINGNTSSQTRGSYFAFILVLVSVICGSYLIHEGKSAAGLTSIIAAIGGAVSVFFYMRNTQTKERDEKSSNLDKRRNR